MVKRHRGRCTQKRPFQANRIIKSRCLVARVQGVAGQKRLQVVGSEIEKNLSKRWDSLTSLMIESRSSFPWGFASDWDRSKSDTQQFGSISLGRFSLNTITPARSQVVMSQIHASEHYPELTSISIVC